MSEEQQKKRAYLTPFKALQLSRDGLVSRIRARVRDRIDEFILVAAKGTSARRPATNVSIPVKTLRLPEEHVDIIVEMLRGEGYKAEPKVVLTDDPAAPGGQRATPTHIYVDWSEAKSKWARQ